MNFPAPNRRDFLRTAALGGLSALLPAQAPAAEAAAWPRTVGLGGTLRVPLLGMGTGVRAGNRSNQLFRHGQDKFDATILRAWEEGVRLFDCADSYGSLPHVGRALKDKPRDSYVLVSKIWCHPKGGIPDHEPRDNATAVVERFLKEAGSEFIDVVQVHCQTHADWPARYRRQMDQLEECKQRGLLKAHGCSCHTLEALSAAADEPWVDVVHSRINPWGVKMDGPADKVVPILKKIHAAGKGVIGMKLVGEGEFSNDSAKIDEALRFVLGLGCVDALIVGFENPEQITDYKARLLKALA